MMATVTFEVTGCRDCLCSQNPDTYTWDRVCAHPAVGDRIHPICQHYIDNATPPWCPLLSGG